MSDDRTKNLTPRQQARLDAERIDCPHDILKAFLEHMDRARFRHIPFEFSLEQWRDWWTTDNRWSRRGRGSADFCMARFGDVGPYSINNTYCATNAQNIRDVGTERRSAFMREWRSGHTRSSSRWHRRTLVMSDEQFAFLSGEAKRYGIGFTEAVRRIIDKYREAKIK